MRQFRRLAYCQRGVAAVEFALIALPLIIVTIGIIEVGRALFLTNELAHSADRAARVVMLDFDISEADLMEAVRDEERLVGLVPENLNVVSPVPTSSAEEFRTVTITYPFVPILADFTIDSLSLTAERRIAR